VGSGPRGTLQGSWHLGQQRTRPVRVVLGSKGPKMRRQGEIAAAQGLGSTAASYPNPSGEQAVPGLGCAGGLRRLRVAPKDGCG
jgi:hypothetical protein